MSSVVRSRRQISSLAVEHAGGHGIEGRCPDRGTVLGGDGMSRKGFSGPSVEAKDSPICGRAE